MLALTRTHARLALGALARGLAVALALVVPTACAERGTVRAGREPPDAVSAASAHERAPLRLIFVTDLEGVLEPCGCGGGPAGGVDRLVAAVDELRHGADRAEVLAAGDSFYAREAQPAARVQDRWKAEMIADVLARMNALLIADAQSALVALPGTPLRVAVLGEAPSPYALAALSGAIALHTGHAQASGAAASGEALVVRGARRSEGLLWIDVWPSDQAGAGWRVATAAPREPAIAHAARIGARQLDASAPQDAEVRAQLDALFARIGAHNAAVPSAEHAVARPLPDDDHAGAETCAACHTPAYFWWRNSPHGRSLATLEGRGRALDFDCVGCHATGPPPSARAPEAPPAHAGVGCESCHGAGRAHADNPAAHPLPSAVPERRCRACHDRDHSPAFDHARAALRLVAPGHGAALRAGAGSAPP